MNNRTDYSYNRPNEFINLTDTEIEKFNKLGINGDNLRKHNNFYVDLYGNKYYFNEYDKLIKEFDF